MKTFNLEIGSADLTKAGTDVQLLSLSDRFESDLRLLQQFDPSKIWTYNPKDYETMKGNFNALISQPAGALHDIIFTEVSAELLKIDPVRTGKYLKTRGNDVSDVGSVKFTFSDVPEAIRDKTDKVPDNATLSDLLKNPDQLPSDYYSYIMIGALRHEAQAMHETIDKRDSSGVYKNSRYTDVTRLNSELDRAVEIAQRRVKEVETGEAGTVAQKLEDAISAVRTIEGTAFASSDYYVSGMMDQRSNEWRFAPKFMGEDPEARVRAEITGGGYVPGQPGAGRRREEKGQIPEDDMNKVEDLVRAIDDVGKRPFIDSPSDVLGSKGIVGREPNASYALMDRELQERDQKKDQDRKKRSKEDEEKNV
jgi:hypothetical protein